MLRRSIRYRFVALLCILPLTVPAQVLTGADLLLRLHGDLVRGQRVGLITNHTGRLRSGALLLDSLQAAGVSVAALFSPEHGIRGTGSAGNAVGDTVDLESGIPVYSLYGARHAPTPEMLDRVDILLYDIQDVGARFYTYISTMLACMDAAATRKIPFVVLDRPNPLGGLLVDGPVMEDSLRSFVGAAPIPVVYGLTCGELAAMANGEGWLAGGKPCELTVVPMAGWKRDMQWRATGLQWVPPSPNIPDPETALAYPVTCFLEATNISEGRGTTAPFRIIGAPFIHGDHLARRLNHLHLPGLAWKAVDFVPVSSKYAGIHCGGVRLQITAPESVRPAAAAISLLSAIYQECGKKLEIRFPRLARLSGTWRTGEVVPIVPKGIEFIGSWAGPREEFNRVSRKYRIYE
jgi:uncharacterized protein YbbC (DUF1343 family)